MTEYLIIYLPQLAFCVFYFISCLRRKKIKPIIGAAIFCLFPLGALIGSILAF